MRARRAGCRFLAGGAMLLALAAAAARRCGHGASWGRKAETGVAGKAGLA